MLKTASSFWVLQARKVLGSEGNPQVLVDHVFLHENLLPAIAKVKLPVFTPSALFLHLPPSLFANSPSTLFFVLYGPYFLPLLLYNPNCGTCSSVNSSFKPIPAPGFPKPCSLSSSTVKNAARTTSSLTSSWLPPFKVWQPVGWEGRRQDGNIARGIWWQRDGACLHCCWGVGVSARFRPPEYGTGDISVNCWERAHSL